MHRQNISFIGLSGVGKSTIGKAFSQAIGWGFVDTDILLKEKTGKDPQTLLDTSGEGVFLVEEDRVLSALNLKKHVIATGGSAIYCEAGLAHLKSISLVIYLKDKPDNIKARVKRLDQRGIVMAGAPDMASLMTIRQGLYEEKADVVFQVPYPFNVSLAVQQLAALVFNTPLKNVLAPI